MISRTSISILTLTLCLFSCSCSARHSSSYFTPDPISRNTARAEDLSREAAYIIMDDPDKAQRLLSRALEYDIYHGPSHNNLGVVYLVRGELYSAANEFEWARKLMPGHPDPRINLALTLERAGQLDDASNTYRSALELAPFHLEALTGLARLQIRTGGDTAETIELLRSIERQTDDAALRAWAYDQRNRLR